MKEMGIITAELVAEALQPKCRRSRASDWSSKKIGLAKRLFVETAREICPGWQVAAENRGAVTDIFRWCLELDGRLDPGKGLCLCGNIGTGKSTMLAIVKEFCRRIGRLDDQGNLYGFRITNTLEVCRAYQTEGYVGIAEYCDLQRQAFDELGAEPTMTGHYGTPLDVMGTVVMARYDNRHDGFTHVTTNLTERDLEERYGGRVYDRMREMMNFVTLAGRSWRGIAPVR